MSKKSSVFLSYSRNDRKQAVTLERALTKQGLHVWRDERSIAAGEHWSNAIEKGIRESRGVVVLLTTASADSEWVVYEYAFATGAGIPVVAVVVPGVRVPRPVQRFQIVPYGGVRGIASKVKDGVRDQSRTAGHLRASSPNLVAKFQEKNGVIRLASGGDLPSICMDLWVENAPSATQRVFFEIPDRGFRDRKWTVRRKSRESDAFREFLTDKMKSYGDVEIWAYGVLSREKNWSTRSTLYEALVSYYRSRPSNTGIRRALAQIRRN